jgi:hypothetical protein
MIIKGEKGRLIVTLNLINSEIYPDILKSLLRMVQLLPEGVHQDDRINILMLLEDLMPESKQIERMIEAEAAFKELPKV